MADEGRPTRSPFWPILLIGIGIAFLLFNLDLIPRPNLSALLSLWPLILIGIGLDLVLRRRFPAISALIAIGVVAVAVAVLALAPSLGFGAQAELTTERFREPVGEAGSARITLDLARYSTTVDGLTDSGTLIDAELDTLESVQFQASGTSVKSISLSERSSSGTRFIFPDFLTELASDASWEIHLNPNTPLDLTVDAASGSTDLALFDLTLTNLLIDGGSGSTTVTLPSGESNYDSLFDGGSGSLAVTIPDGSDASAVFNGGSGSLTLVVGDAADVKADIDGGSGRVRVEVPEQAAVRVVIRDDASGSVSLPARFNLVDDFRDGDSDTGIWETAGYNAAEHLIEITFDPGSGSFAVQ